MSLFEDLNRYSWLDLEAKRMRHLDLSEGQPIVCDIQTVFDYMWGQMGGAKEFSRKLIQSSRDLPVRPPYDLMFLEYRFPVGDRVGVLLHTISEGHPDFIDVPEGTKWLVGVQVFACPFGQKAFRASGSLFLSLDGFGVYQCQQEVGQDAELLHTYLEPALQALVFMHVRGSSIEEIPPTRTAIRKAERRNRPLLRHHTLVIRPLEEYMRHAREAARQGHTSLHTVRGHFVTYTEDAPLFGHYVGTVWRAAHWRGDKSHGAVLKDYSLEMQQAA